MRYITFIIVIYTLVVQPATDTYNVFNNDYHELTDHSVEGNDNEEEKQEVDSRKEKSEYHTISFKYSFYPNNKAFSGYIHLKLQCNFSQEIPIPPPERI